MKASNGSDEHKGHNGNSESIPVALVLRNSSDAQDTSIERQRLNVQPLLEREHYSVVTEYVDEGVPGAKFHKRKALHKLLEDAPSGKWKGVVSDELFRLSRQEPFELIAKVIYPLRQAGAFIHTVREGRIFGDKALIDF